MVAMSFKQITLQSSLQMMQASTLLNKQMMYQMIMKWKAVPNMEATTITETAVLRISG
jgi:hypothetical protein